MPVSVNSVLRESLAGSGGIGQILQSQIASATKHLVLKPVEYEEYPDNFIAQNDALKAKYILLSADSDATGSCGSPKKILTIPNSTKGHHGPDTNGGSVVPKKENVNKNELPLPKRIFFPREKVQVGWKGNDRKWQIGAGFLNVGNTCYLNSTLQALLHVPAMANWLASDSDKCSDSKDGQCCIICAMSKTLLSTQTNQYAVKPWLVYSKLRLICKHLVHGRQEDAHEFLRYLIEAMEKAYLYRYTTNLASLDQYSKETTPLNQILGGYLRSSVRCLSCNHISITFQHFEDLLLDIRKANTIDEALQGYFAREKLEDMGYNCEGCKKKVTATKQFSLERPPVVLCIQLKRFSMAGTKLNKQVSIKPKLDLSPFVKKSAAHGQPLSYRLVSMVTHLGASQHCGHYTAIGLTESGTYYQFDDSSVRPISLQNVLQTNAYIMFYELESGQQRQSNGLSTMASSANGNHTTNVIKSTSGLALKLNGESTKTEASSSGVVTAPHENGKENGNGSVNFNRFIGPVLPPNYPATDRERTNGDGATGSTLTNGNGRNKSPSSAVKESESLAGALIKLKSPTGEDPARKYPSPEILFKSPLKQNDFTFKGKSVSPPEADSKSTVQQISPRSLVPYNSDSSSDEDDSRETKREEKKRKLNMDRTATNTTMKNGNGGPYVKTNSGVWKVYDAVPDQNGDSKHGGFKNKTTGTVVNELLKQDHKAYGGVAVSTWSGQKSNFDKEVSVEKSLKRALERKTDDEEMDRGKTKKMRMHQKVGRDNPGYNPFQEYQNKQQPSIGNNHQAWVNNGRPHGGMGMYRPKFKWRPGQSGNHNNNNHNKRPMHSHYNNRYKQHNNGFNRNFRNHSENQGRHPKFNGGGFRHNQ